jgi:hypothetical protein
MRFKIQISVPAMLATALCIFGLASMLFFNLKVANGRFLISIGLSTMLTYLATLILLTVVTFVFVKRREE